LAVTGAMVVGAVAVLNHRGAPTGVGDDHTGAGATTAPDPQSSGGAPSPTAAGRNLVAAPGQFYYWRITGVYPEGSGTAEVWFGADGSGRLERPNPEAPSGRETTTWGPGESPLGDDLSGLSTNPAVLLDQLRARSGTDGESPQPAVTPLDGQEYDTGGLVRAIGDLLTDAPHFLPEQRQAAYEALRSLPTAEDVGTGSDPAGRPAVAVRITTTDGEATFYFDPDTKLFVSERVTFRSEDPAEDMSSFIVMESGGIVDSTSATPGDGQRFFPDAERLPKASGGLVAEPTTKS